MFDYFQDFAVHLLWSYLEKSSNMVKDKINNFVYIFLDMLCQARTKEKGVTLSSIKTFHFFTGKKLSFSSMDDVAS